MEWKCQTRQGKQVEYLLNPVLYKFNNQIVKGKPSADLSVWGEDLSEWEII